MILSNLITAINDISVDDKAHHALDVKDIQCDSRKVAAGDIFAAFRGEHSDGLDYIDQAAKQGAVAILCHTNDALPSEVPSQLAIIRSSNPRLAFAHIVAALYPKQPAHMVAVTGTNGKTSVAHFYRQIWALMGIKSASIGTIGAEDSEQVTYDVASLTTPDALGLHRVLSTMDENGVQAVAIEASSHGLSQYRQDGVRMEAAAFTSFSRDHLDYHKTEEAYFRAKSRLFSEVLPAKATAVLNADIVEYEALRQIAIQRQQHVITYGKNAEDINIISLSHQQGKQQITFSYKGDKYTVETQLLGEFQAYNLLCALGLVIASGGDVAQAISVLKQVQAVKGRMEFIASYNEARIFVDYAHTPDGLEKALTELRYYTDNKLVALFGCGGDRDKGKRPQMAKVACRLADKVIVTDDNPRTEDAAEVRRDIMQACDSHASEIGNRKDAIHNVISQLDKGDIVLIAGKGHEDYQLINGQTYPFNEPEIILNAINALEGK